jgi:competence protein ComEC
MVAAMAASDRTAGSLLHRWFLWIPAAFGTGIAFYFALTVEPALWTGLGTCALATGIAWAMAKSPAGRRPLAAFMALIAIGAAGFAAAQWRTLAVDAPVLKKRIGPVRVAGRIDILEAFENGYRATLALPRISALAPHLTPERIRVRLRGDQPAMLPGDWIEVRAFLNPPSPPALPGGFDFQRQAFFEGIGAVGFSIGKAEVAAQAGEGTALPVSHVIGRLRADLTRRITQALPGPSGAMAAALITGERRAIPDNIIDAMRDSGLAHLLAISGLHIGLVAGLLFGLIRAACALMPPLALNYPIKKWAAVVALVGAFAYALIAGATLPTQRAFLMLSIALLGVMLDRRGITLRSVAWAALAVLAVQPEALLSASFQMSFAAVTALVAVYEGYAARRLISGGGSSRGWLSRLILYAGGVALTTLVAGLATAPFAVYHFNRVADYSLVANLLAVPVTALWIMPWAIAVMAAVPFGLEALALAPMGFGIDLVVRIAETVAGWSGAVTLVPAMSSVGLAAAALGGIWLIGWRSRLRYAGAAVIAVGLLPAVFAIPPDVLVDGEARLVALRGETGRLLVSDIRSAKFERGIWARNLALADDPVPWPATGHAEGVELDCDISGCLFRRAGRAIALVRMDAALAEDCWTADAVISIEPVRRRCPATVVIDRFDLWREGSHAIWLTEQGVRVETVNGRRGWRRWVLRPEGSERPKAPGT